MSKYPVRYGRKDKDVYYIDVFDDEIRQIFDDFSKYGYSFVNNNRLSRIFGMKFSAFRMSGIFSVGRDEMHSTSIFALNQNYSIKKDERKGNRYILFKF